MDGSAFCDLKMYKSPPSIVLLSFFYNAIDWLLQLL